MPEVNQHIAVFNPEEFIDHVMQFEQGGKKSIITVNGRCIPSMTFSRKGFNYILSLPFGLYNSLKDESEINNFLNQIHQQGFSNYVVNIDPLVRLDLKSVHSIANKFGFKVNVNHCHILDTSRSLEEVFNGFNDTRKKHIKRYLKAEKLRVFCTTESIYFEKYYELYLDSMNRWGMTGSGYSQKMIRGLHVVPGIKMWVAELDGTMLSGMICIYHEDGVFDWLAASIINEDVKKLYAPVAVQYEVIKHAVEQKLRYVNMGASVNLNGVSDFKDSWGAEQYETYSFTKQSIVFKLLKAILNRINKK